MITMKFIENKNVIKNSSINTKIQIFFQYFNFIENFLKKLLMYF